MLHLILPIQLYRIGFQIPAWVKFQCKSGAICHANAHHALSDNLSDLKTQISLIRSTFTPDLFNRGADLDMLV